MLRRRFFRPTATAIAAVNSFGSPQQQHAALGAALTSCSLEAVRWASTAMTKQMAKKGDLRRSSAFFGNPQAKDAAEVAEALRRTEEFVILGRSLTESDVRGWRKVNNSSRASPTYTAITQAAENFHSNPQASFAALSSADMRRAVMKYATFRRALAGAIWELLVTVGQCCTLWQACAPLSAPAAEAAQRSPLFAGMRAITNPQRRIDLVVAAMALTRRAEVVHVDSSRRMTRYLTAALSDTLPAPPPSAAAVRAALKRQAAAPTGSKKANNKKPSSSAATPEEVLALAGRVRLLARLLSEAGSLPAINTRFVDACAESGRATLAKIRAPVAPLEFPVAPDVLRAGAQSVFAKDLATGDAVRAFDELIKALAAVKHTRPEFAADSIAAILKPLRHEPVSLRTAVAVVLAENGVCTEDFVVGTSLLDGLRQPETVLRFLAVVSAPAKVPGFVERMALDALAGSSDLAHTEAAVGARSATPAIVAAASKRLFAVLPPNYKGLRLLAKTLRAVRLHADLPEDKALLASAASTYIATATDEVLLGFPTRLQGAHTAVTIAASILPFGVPDDATADTLTVFAHRVITMPGAVESPACVVALLQHALTNLRSAAAGGAMDAAPAVALAPSDPAARGYKRATARAQLVVQAAMDGVVSAIPNLLDMGTSLADATSVVAALVALLGEFPLAVSATKRDGAIRGVAQFATSLVDLGDELPPALVVGMAQLAALATAGDETTGMHGTAGAQPLIPLLQHVLPAYIETIQQAPATSAAESSSKAQKQQKSRAGTKAAVAKKAAAAADVARAKVVVECAARAGVVAAVSTLHPIDGSSSSAAGKAAAAKLKKAQQRQREREAKQLKQGKSKSKMLLPAGAAGAAAIAASGGGGGGLKRRAKVSVTSALGQLELLPAAAAGRAPKPEVEEIAQAALEDWQLGSHATPAASATMAARLLRALVRVGYRRAAIVKPVAGQLVDAIEHVSTPDLAEAVSAVALADSWAGVERWADALTQAVVQRRHTITLGDAVALAEAAAAFTAAHRVPVPKAAGIVRPLVPVFLRSSKALGPHACLRIIAAGARLHLAHPTLYETLFGLIADSKGTMPLDDVAALVDVVRATKHIPELHGSALRVGSSVVGAIVGGVARRGSLDLSGHVLEPLVSALALLSPNDRVCLDVFAACVRRRKEISPAATIKALELAASMPALPPDWVPLAEHAMAQAAKQGGKQAGYSADEAIAVWSLANAGGARDMQLTDALDARIAGCPQEVTASGAARLFDIAYRQFRAHSAAVEQVLLAHEGFVERASADDLHTIVAAMFALRVRNRRAMNSFGARAVELAANFSSAQLRTLVIVLTKAKAMTAPEVFADAIVDAQGQRTRIDVPTAVNCLWFLATHELALLDRNRAYVQLAVASIAANRQAILQKVHLSVQTWEAVDHIRKAEARVHDLERARQLADERAGNVPIAAPAAGDEAAEIGAMEVNESDGVQLSPAAAGAAVDPLGPASIIPDEVYRAFRSASRTFPKRDLPASDTADSAAVATTAAAAASATTTTASVATENTSDAAPAQGSSARGWAV